MCGLAKKRIRVSKGTKGSQNHDIFGGKAQILRVPQSGDVWQFRMWIAAEKKYLRKSLQSRVGRYMRQAEKHLENVCKGQFP